MTAVLVLALLQEETRTVDRFGEQTKILTHGQIDAWVFDGKRGETIHAFVRTGAFDPVLELVNAKDEVLASVDDPGSQSRFSAELPADGTYRVRVRAFKDSGGGSYALRLDRFRASALTLEAPGAGSIDPDGRGHHRIEAKAGDLVRIRVLSASIAKWELVDDKGDGLPAISGLARITRTGAHYVRAFGPAGTAYRVTAHRAVVRALEGDESRKGEVGETTTEAWDVEGTPSQLLRVDVVRTGPLSVDVAYVPSEASTAEETLPADSMEELVFLDRYEKGARTSLACLLGRKGRYRIVVQTPGPAAVSYDVRALGTAAAVEVGRDLRGTLALGEFSVTALALKAGQVVSIDLTADRFDAVLTLFNARGERLLQSDDRGLELSSRITFQSREDVSYWIVAAAAAHAGAGDYTLAVREQPVHDLKPLERTAGDLPPGGIDIWRFEARRDERVLISVVSAVFDPMVRVFDAQGVELARDDNGGTDADSLAAVRVPEDGAVSVWVSSRSGYGAYTVRRLEP